MIDQSETREGNLRFKEVVRRTGLSKTEIYRRLKRKKFPIPRKIGPKIVVWPASHIRTFNENPELDSDAYDIL